MAHSTIFFDKTIVVKTKVAEEQSRDCREIMVKRNKDIITAECWIKNI